MSARIPWWLGVCLFLGIAVLLLWEEHEAHILGAAPYLLLLACPIIHLLMHRGHAHDEHGDGAKHAGRRGFVARAPDDEERARAGSR